MGGELKEFSLTMMLSCHYVFLSLNGPTYVIKNRFCFQAHKGHRSDRREETRSDRCRMPRLSNRSTSAPTSTSTGRQSKQIHFTLLHADESDQVYFKFQSRVVTLFRLCLPASSRVAFLQFSQLQITTYQLRIRFIIVQLPRTLCELYSEVQVDNNLLAVHTFLAGTQ